MSRSIDIRAAVFVIEAVLVATSAASLAMRAAIHRYGSYTGFYRSCNIVTGYVTFPYYVLENQTQAKQIII
jgi:hypothetical protein